ncbi:m7GpppX diphosphatase [Asbolus verrucosus]|uniref:m7GpppX diphosphatase n=1 Tax=Asbolus verrucosus TaxID=1661398 RepID=A0A482VBJ1_ASBVE|nr:m7GpppX diphosphatase [Asbolus verrucosus]
MEDNNIAPNNFSNVCRTCLMENCEMKDIFGSSIDKLLKECTSLELNSGDGLPELICEKCINRVNDAYSFKLLCKSSDETLKTFFKKSHSSKDAEEPLTLLNDYDCTNDTGAINEGDIDDSKDEADDNIKIQDSQKSGHEKAKEAAKESEGLQCKLCGQILNNNNEEKDHMETCHPSEDQHICGKCKKEYSDIKLLKRHLRVHKLKKKHLCPTCGKGFYGVTDLTIHTRVHTGEKPLTCTVCSKAFADPRGLSSHMKTHTGLKPYSCNTCGKSFAHSFVLSTHMRTHTAERPYVCSSCGKTFVYSHNLAIHMRSHTGERPYQCQQCYKTFSSSSTLTAHIMIHTGEKRFVCTVCGKKVARSGDLQIHMRTHTGERPYACNLCTKRYRIDEVEDCSPTKKPKFEEKCRDAVHETLIDLSTFKLEKILHNNTNRKTVCLKGKFDSKNGDALVLLEKTAFAEENLTENSEYFTKNSLLEKVFHNDIYGNYNYFPQINLNSVKATIIHPATEKHFLKYSAQDCHIVDETPGLYKDIILPHVTSEQFNLNWLYNILDHQSESDRIVFEDPDPETGFILLPDLKWNGEVDTLYLLAIARKRDIKSLRDLTDKHLPLLKNIKKKGIESIKSKYGLDGSQLRIYLHYQPSFYHLHVHFTYLKHEAPGILAERAHLLSNVISNIELLPDYYQKVTLPIKIVLNADNFQIIANEETSTVSCKNLNIVLNSLSSLNITQTYISFRFATVNSFNDWGSFKTELLKTSQIASSLTSESPFLNQSVAYSIQCKNCLQDLSDTLSFNRVLPLPSENSEPSDWFCHAHDGSAVVNLNPKESDIFYTQCYCHLNKHSTKNTLESDKVIVCKRCLCWLGLKKNPDTNKFWFNTVRFKDKNNVHTTCALEDVFRVLREILNSILFSTAKIILSCHSSKNQVDYILLWILEKQLSVQIHSGDNQDCKVAKVLFKYESNSSEIVKKWEADSSVTNVDVSKPMTVAVLKHLYKFNKIFPEEFSESNNFYISYLMIANEETKEDSEEINDDLISFLDKPLPPPLPYRCQNCDQSFSEENDLKIHQSVHSDKLYIYVNTPERGRFCVQYATKRSPIQADKPYVCKQCFSSFENKSALLLHYKQHGGAKIKNICRVCGKRLATHASLQEHLNTHAEEKPHECGICFRKFIHKSSLNKHSKIHEKGFHDENNTFINCSQFEQPSEDPLDLDADNNLYTENTFL